MKWDRFNRRRAIVWGAWSLVLVAGLGGLFAWHAQQSYEEALRSFATQVGSPDHRDYLPEPVTNGVDAALALQAAATEAVLGRDLARAMEPAAWTDGTESAAEAAIARNREALEQIVSASRLRPCVWDDTAVVETRPFVSLLRGARLLRLEAFVGIVNGDELRVRVAFESLGALADCVYAAPHLVGSLVAASIERMQLEVVHAAVASPSTSVGQLELFRAQLETRNRVDRVARAVAAEGALALRLLEEEHFDDSVHRWVFRSLLFKRMSATLARRWVEFAKWSRKPLGELIENDVVLEGGGRSIAKIVAEIATANLKHAVIMLSTNKALTGLARVAVDARLFGERTGSYDGALDPGAGLSVLDEGDGSTVLIDQKLEKQLREYFGASLEGEDRSAEAVLDLTVWRLAPPATLR